MKKSLECIYCAFKNTLAHDGMEHAGYLSFVILLSIFPFLVFLTAVVDFLNQYDPGRKFLLSIIESVPDDMISSLMPRINEIVSGPPQNLLTLAIVGAIWTSSSAVEGMRTILNKAYRVLTPPHYILRRLLSIAQIFVITSVVLVTMMCIALVPIVSDFFNWKLSNYIRYVFSEFILFITVSWLYFMLPNIKQKFISVIPGALMVIVLWTLAALIFRKYLKTFHQLSIIYGSLAGIIVSLLFFYILSFIFIYGAELNYQLFKCCYFHKKN